jgi:hypothetical protein
MIMLFKITWISVQNKNKSFKTGSVQGLRSSQLQPPCAKMMAVFYVVAPHSLVEVYRRFGGA